MSPWVPPRPSEFFINANCTGSYELMRQSGEEPATIYAFKGTKVHRVLAASGSIGDLDPDESKSFEELWNKFRDTLRSWRAGAQVDEVWNEQEFVFRDKDGQALFVGHPDKVIKSGSRLFIPDFKTGWHTFDAIAATNCQLRGYVALADANIEGITEATVWIDKPGKTTPPAIYDRHAIDEARRWSLEVVSEITRPGPKKLLRGGWCHYCSGKVICPLWRDEIQTLAASTDLVDQMPDHQLALIAPKLDIAGKVIERLKARLEARVRENPEFFSDWHFQPGRVLPEIQSVTKAWLALKEDLDDDADAFMGAAKLTIGELVKLYREKTKTTWKAAREEVDKKLGDNLKYDRAKPSLVYDPQPRAINTTVADGN